MKQKDASYTLLKFPSNESDLTEEHQNDGQMDFQMKLETETFSTDNLQKFIKTCPLSQLFSLVHFNLLFNLVLL